LRIGTKYLLSVNPAVAIVVLPCGVANKTIIEHACYTID
jgi:hypothetical protein